MAQLVIYTYLSTTAALACSSPEAGDLAVTPTAEQLASLTEEQRQTLAKFATTDRRRASLTVQVPGWPGVVAGLDAECAKRAAEAAEHEACIEHERASYRALLAGEDALVNGWDHAPNYSRDDPEAKALWAELQARQAAEREARVLAADAALGDDLDAHITPELTADDATTEVLTLARKNHNLPTIETPRASAIAARAQARHEAAAAATQTEQREQARAYVLAHCPDYHRAAADGRDVLSIAVRHITARIEALGDVAWTEGDERDCDAPTDAAYAVLDALRAETDDLATEIGPLAVVVPEGYEITRLDTCSQRGCDTAWRVCAGVIVRVAGKPVLVYRHADIEPPHEHEDDTDLT